MFHSLVEISSAVSSLEVCKSSPLKVFHWAKRCLKFPFSCHEVVSSSLYSLKAILYPIGKREQAYLNIKKTQIRNLLLMPNVPNLSVLVRNLETINSWKSSFPFSNPSKNVVNTLIFRFLHYSLYVQKTEFLYCFTVEHFDDEPAFDCFAFF